MKSTSNTKGTARKTNTNKGGAVTKGSANTKGVARTTNTNKGAGTNGNTVRASKKKGRGLDRGEARMAEMLAKKRAKAGKTVNKGKIKKLAIKKTAAKRRAAGK